MSEIHSRFADIVNSRRLIEGPRNDLMTISPAKHAWARDIHKQMKANNWFPEEIDLTRDKLQYETLEPGERRMYDKALSFLSNLDGIQVNNLMNNITPFVTSPEVVICLTRQSWEEANHVESYLAIAEAISADPMEVTMAFERDGMLARKNEYIMRQSRILGQDYSPKNFALAIVANIILEGIYFYSGFLCFYTLARRGKMLGSADMIRFIQRDEGGTHLNLFTHMFWTLKQERPEIFDEDFYQRATQLFREGVNLEIAWGQYMIKDGVLGLTDPIVEGRIKHLGNIRSASIGIPTLYPGVKDPCAWVEDFSRINNDEKNFFEGKNQAYQIGTPDW